jgi:hypothetical protein
MSSRNPEVTFIVLVTGTAPEFTALMSSLDVIITFYMSQFLPGRNNGNNFISQELQ